MRKTSLALTVMALLALGAGCGDEDSAQKKPATSPATTAGVPSYAEVKQLALRDPELTRRCAKVASDRTVGLPAQGEIYKRLSCGGSEVLDYVVGSGGYRDNFGAARRIATAPVWAKPDRAYVKVALSGPKDLAAEIHRRCSCGEVVQPN